jgi:uncharacterized protein YndB with AHSA1/START domain
MKQIDQTYIIQAPVGKVWQALTDQSLMAKWSGGPATMDARVGGAFSMWDGDVYGTNVELVPEELLVQDWCGGDDPDKPYPVTFTLTKVNQGTTEVSLRHANVPDDEYEDFAEGWIDYYFDPIKELLEDTEVSAE